MTLSLSQFAASVEMESAFDVLAIAKRLSAAGKDVIELEIGDSPFPPSPSAALVGKQAIDEGHCRYAPSAGLDVLRSAAADYVNAEYGFQVSSENVLIGPGAKNFEQLFCEAFVDPGQSVLVFTPHFPTYPPNIQRRGANVVYSSLTRGNQFRPNLDDVERFVTAEANAKAIFLNSPHNPTGGVATPEDLCAIADLVRGRDIAVFSDEPYDRMAWQGKHASIATEPGMLDQSVAAYTFSKSFSMSGWRLGFAITTAEHVATLTKLTNAALSCVAPFAQMAGAAVLRDDQSYRDECMEEFRQRLQLLASGLDSIDGIACDMPSGTFYAFADVTQLCAKYNMTSHGFAMYLLENAEDELGVACLGGECFGPAGKGFLRFSVAEPRQRLQQAIDLIRRAVRDEARIRAHLHESH